MNWKIAAFAILALVAWETYMKAASSGAGLVTGTAVIGDTGIGWVQLGNGQVVFERPQVPTTDATIPNQIM